METKQPEMAKASITINPYEGLKLALDARFQLT